MDAILSLVCNYYLDIILSASVALLVAIFTLLHAIANGTKVLLHYNIMKMGKQLLRQNTITEFELNELVEMYNPYENLKGNGTAKRIVISAKDKYVKDLERIKNNDK